jgi:hypothetical protein
MPKRKRNNSKQIHLPIPKWVSTAYLIMCAILVPWTVYLSASLPARHLSTHWDISWVGLDIGITVALFCTALLAAVKSKWVVLAATMTGSFLLVDAWFDVISEHHGVGLVESVILAAFVEIPVAIMSFMVAYHVLSYELK